MWFCSFQDHLHFWKNWTTAPVAVQRHKNTDPLPRERVYRSVAPGTCRCYVVCLSVSMMDADRRGIITTLHNVDLFVSRPLTFLEKLDDDSCCWAAAQQWGCLFFGVRSEDLLLAQCGVCLMDSL
jgi:hypothetical protein